MRRVLCRLWREGTTSAAYRPETEDQGHQSSVSRCSVRSACGAIVSRHRGPDRDTRVDLFKEYAGAAFL